MEHFPTDEHLPLALQVILPLLVIGVPKCSHNFSAALLLQYCHLRVIAAQNTGIPIYFIIFFHIRLSSHIRERLASAHGLLPSWFFLMIVLLMAKGDLLFPLFAEGFSVAMLVCGGGVSHGSSVCIMFQSFSQLNQTAHNTPPVSTRAVNPSSRLLQGM